MLRNNLMLPTEALDIPEAIDFDGTNDYLSRASDLTGNADGKTFTFSFWVWNTLTGEGQTQILYRCGPNSSSGFRIILGQISGSYYLQVFGYNATPTNVLQLNIAISNSLAMNTWNHILFSFDLNNAASRYCYVNDISASHSWEVYTNAAIDRTQASHTVGGNSSAASYSRARIAHFFLDYTYRDLSNVTNRRLFIVPA